MSLYLLINITSILIPFIFSFHARSKFYKHWGGFFIGFFIIGALFIGWDIVFTKLGIWGFNADYLVGFKLVNLPIEEWLFFLCIPYASIFTHYSLIKFKFLYLNPKVTSVVSILLIVLFLSIAVIYYDRMYTFVTSLVTIFTIFVGLLFFKGVLQRFYLTYLVVLIPFTIVNGILTGSFIENEVVWYNNSENLGIRLFTIPVEDVFYGFSLLIGILYIMNLTYNPVKQNK